MCPSPRTLRFAKFNVRTAPCGSRYSGEVEEECWIPTSLLATLCACNTAMGVEAGEKQGTMPAPGHFICQTWAIPETLLGKQHFGALRWLLTAKAEPEFSRKVLSSGFKIKGKCIFCFWKILNYFFPKNRSVRNLGKFSFTCGDCPIFQNMLTWN